LNDAQIRIDDIAAWSPGSEDEQAVAAPTDTEWLPTDSSLIGHFKDVVAKFGDKTAISWRDNDYTYRDIDRWSDAVAWNLRDLGAEPGAGVGVMVGRQPEFIV